MPFLRDNTYVDADSLTGADVRANHEALRTFVNRGLVAADLASGNIDWTHVLAGEYAHITPDHRFTTGHHYSLFQSSESAQQTAVGVSMKPAGIDADLFVAFVAKRGRASVGDALALVTAFVAIQPAEDTYTVGADGSGDKVYLYVDGVQVAHTEARFYAQDNGGTSEAGGDLESRVRVATIHHLVPALTAGLHLFDLRIDPRHAVTLITARNFNIEFFEV